MIAVGATVRVRGFHGVACRYVGPQTERYRDDDSDEIEERETGLALVVMIGDDHKHAIDPDDMTEIDPDGVCSCGQIGCHADNESGAVVSEIKKARDLRAGDVFTVKPRDPESATRVCLSNDGRGIRWGYPGNDRFWCSMGDACDVVIVGTAALPRR